MSLIYINFKFNSTVKVKAKNWTWKRGAYSNAQHMLLSHQAAHAMLY